MLAVLASLLLPVLARAQEGPLLRPSTTAFVEDAYRLGTGDKVRVIVFGEDDLGGEFQVDGNGHISLPLIGELQAGGKTAANLEADI
ncbi:MAG: polysaccharide biosynthesis/export family protein, partial [Alphaproteobacteria bacterium]|nr:polysaccharide biosynthesis/export family protein [Alphaproteobacteria bacterium]